jgi:hypothetical protein
MRAPMPKPLQQEIDTLYRLLKNLGLPVIDIKETRCLRVRQTAQPRQALVQ